MNKRIKVTVTLSIFAVFSLILCYQNKFSCRDDLATRSDEDLIGIAISSLAVPIKQFAAHPTKDEVHAFIVHNENCCYVNRKSDFFNESVFNKDLSIVVSLIYEAGDTENEYDGDGVYYQSITAIDECGRVSHRAGERRQEPLLHRY